LLERVKSAESSRSRAQSGDVESGREDANGNLPNALNQVAATRRDAPQCAQSAETRRNARKAPKRAVTRCAA